MWLRIVAVVAAVLVAGSIISLIAYFLLNGGRVNKSEPTATAYIEVNDQGFSPSLLAVEPNTDVIWVNRSSSPVHITAFPLEDGDKPVFDSGNSIVKPQENFSIRIKKGVGVTIKYHDELHPDRLGGITIVESVPR